MAKAKSNGTEQATNSNIAFDAPAANGGAEVSTAVDDSPVQQDLAGIYQFVVKSYIETDSAKNERTHTPHIALPVVWKTGNDGKTRKFCITIDRGTEIKPLKCEKCAKIFESEPLLRPGGVKDYPDEAKWIERHQNSLFCPDCKAKGLLQKGLPVRTDGLNVLGRLIRPTWFLTHDEALRVRKYLTDGRPIEQVENQRQADGKNLVVGTKNYRDVKFVRYANVQGMNKLVEIGPLVAFNETPFPESWSPLGTNVDMSAMAITFQQVRSLQNKISTLDTQIESAMAKGETATKIAAMFAQRKAWVEQCNALTQKVSSTE